MVLQRMRYHSTVCVGHGHGPIAALTCYAVRKRVCKVPTKTPGKYAYVSTQTISYGTMVSAMAEDSS